MPAAWWTSSACPATRWWNSARGCRFEVLAASAVLGPVARAVDADQRARFGVCGTVLFAVRQGLRSRVLSRGHAAAPSPGPAGNGKRLVIGGDRVFGGIDAGGFAVEYGCGCGRRSLAAERCGGGLDVQIGQGRAHDQAPAPARRQVETMVYRRVLPSVGAARRSGCRPPCRAARPGPAWPASPPPVRPAAATTNPSGCSRGSAARSVRRPYSSSASHTTPPGSDGPCQAFAGPTRRSGCPPARKPRWPRHRAHVPGGP
jgi:hypothetical protein